MRKRQQGKTLSRNASQQKAMKRIMMTNLVEFSSIKTTLAKAKFLKPFAEHLISKAKKVTADKKTLINVLRDLKKDVSVKTAKDIVKLANKYKKVNGGYLRIVKLPFRKSDGAEMAILEWVNHSEKNIKKNEKKKIEKKAKKKGGVIKDKKL